MDSVLDAENELTQGREHASGGQEVKDEVAELKERLDWITAAANERQKELESTWSTVKHFHQTATLLVTQMKQSVPALQALMGPGVDPSNAAKQIKVRVRVRVRVRMLVFTESL